MVTRRDGRSLDRSILEYVRINSIERWLNGEPPQSIIQTTGLCHTTIYKWIHSYQTGGMGALQASSAPGNPPKLSDKQCAQLRPLIVGKDPRQYGFDFGLWTRRLIVDLIQEKFGISIGLTAVGALLARLEITPQKPLRRAYERDPEAIKEWKDQRYPRLKKDAQREGREIIYWDEAGYRLDDQVGRTWGAKGQTPEVAATGKRGRTNSAVAMSEQGAFWYEEFTNNLNAETFSELIKRFMRTRRKKVLLIIDQHPAHTAKAAQSHLASYGEKLRVEFLPGYAPELNPVEYVNQYAKSQGPRKHLPENRQELSAIVRATLDGLKGAFMKVKAFFGHKELAFMH